MSVAARNGAILAGWKGPPVWLRNGLWGVTRSPAFRFGLPYGNSGCPSATAPFSPRAAGVLYDLRSACLCQQKSLSGLLGLAESGEYSLSQTKSASLFSGRMGLPAVNHTAARACVIALAAGRHSPPSSDGGVVHLVPPKWPLRPPPLTWRKATARSTAHGELSTVWSPCI